MNFNSLKNIIGRKANDCFLPIFFLDPERICSFPAVAEVRVLAVSLARRAKFWQLFYNNSWKAVGFPFLTQSRYLDTRMGWNVSGSWKWTCLMSTKVFTWIIKSQQGAQCKTKWFLNQNFFRMVKYLFGFYCILIWFFQYWWSNNWSSYALKAPKSRSFLVQLLVFAGRAVSDSCDNLKCINSFEVLATLYKRRLQEEQHKCSLKKKVWRRDKLQIISGLSSRRQ